jgi:type VI secretion system secreted protein VgrG
MDNFERCQKFVSVAEGDANFNVINGKPVLKPQSKNDRGGPTKYGITIGTLAKAYSQGLVDHNDIIKLTKPEANRIYETNYWKPSRADKMAWGLCLVHYDCAVNCGVSGAAKQLQRALNDLAGAEVVRVDGVIGPASLAAVDRVDWREITRQYLEVRRAYYNGLVAKNSSQGKFLEGWLNRLGRLKTEVGVNG